MSGTIHLIAAVVVIVGIPFLAYLHYQIQQELRTWCKASAALAPMMGSLSGSGIVATPTRVLLDEDMERRIRALEEDRAAFALAFEKRFKNGEQILKDVEQSIKMQRTTIATLEPKWEALTREIALVVQKVELIERNPIDSNGRLTMWGSE